jgi:hypothetical protein
MQNLLHFNSLEQNLLDSTVPNAKYFAFVPLEMQNRLDFLGHGRPQNSN